MNALTSCSRDWSSSVTSAAASNRHNTDTVCDSGAEAGYLMAASTATSDCHCSACSVPCSSKVSDLISSGSGASGWK